MDRPARPQDRACCRWTASPAGRTRYVSRPTGRAPMDRLGLHRPDVGSMGRLPADGPREPGPAWCEPDMAAIPMGRACTSRTTAGAGWSGREPGRPGLVGAPLSGGALGVVARGPSFRGLPPALVVAPG